VNDPQHAPPESPLAQGVALLLQNKFEEASPFFSECIRENPECLEAYLGRGRCAAGRGEHEQAVDDYSAGLDLDCNSAETLWSRALSFTALGKHDSALNDLNDSLRIRPDFAEAYCARAIERIRRGQTKAAVEDCTEAIRLDFGFAEAFYQRHLAHAKLAEKDLAERDYEEARRLGGKKDKAPEIRQAVAAPEETRDAPPKIGPPSAEPESEPESEPITAHVLFMDVVKSGHLTANQQKRTNAKLTEVVVNTRDFREARDCDEVVALPTGDGMALVFKRKFEAPLRCSLEIARALRAEPFCKLRMGIHSGVVFLHQDINGNPNVTGPGINLAERVMSCGEDGHILVSGSAAELLRHLTAWKTKLQYLGEYLAKSDWVQIWNFQDGVIGNPAPPGKPSRQPKGFVESS